MMTKEQTERNMDAYLRLKKMIERTYAPGWFVGIADQQVVAAAENFEDLQTQLRTKGLDPPNVLVVEAGVEYPEYVTIYI
jgi:hypothetical protein